MRYLYIINPISLYIDFESEIYFKKAFAFIVIATTSVALRIYLSRDKFPLAKRQNGN